jgi:hypothetical protein
MLGPVESVALAAVILVPLFLIIKRSTNSYAPAAAPRWWQVWL